MVKFYSGIAGSRGKNPLGFILHNDAGSQNANAAFYRSWLPNHDAYNGFAHYYVASDGTYQAENDGNIAWHSGNTYYNTNFIGIEACQSFGNQQTFLSNENKCFDLMARLCTKYGITPNRTTIILHQEVAATSCPHRSFDLHGQSINAIKDYFISEIKMRMTGTVVPPSSNVPSGYNTIAGASQPVRKGIPGYSEGHLDEFGRNSVNTFYTRGWHIGNYAYQYIILMDYNTNKELTRKLAPGVSRPDVNRAFNTSGNVGFSLSFPSDKLKGYRVYAILRCTNDPEGNTKGGYSDISYRDYWTQTV